MIHKRKIKYLFSFVLALWASALSAQAQTHWSFNPNLYQNDMTVYFELQKGGEAVPASELSNYEVAAFVGEECRGVAEFKSDAGITYGYLRVRSNAISGETVSFKFYDNIEKFEGDINETISFESQSVVGTLSNLQALTIKMCTLSLIVDEAQGTVTGDGDYYSGQEVTVRATVNDGFQFAQWTKDSESVSTSNTYSFTITENTELTANFTPVEYTITYDLDGGTWGTTIPDNSYTAATPTFTLKRPTKEGLSFAGWIGTDLDQPTFNVRIQQGSSGNRSYKATWTDVVIVKGDVDGDGKINSVDLSLLIGKILGQEDPRFIEAAGDLNDDGKFNSVDLSLLINLILNQ